MSVLHRVFSGIAAAMMVSAIAQDSSPASARELPSVQNFEPVRYLGKWFEVARLPTRIQPAGTLAVAEYSAGKQDGMITVKNSAFNEAGKKVSEIEGHAKIAQGNPPGRLLVSFGLVPPEIPNYHVLHVDKDYRYAVVGVPDRQSLWILAREIPIKAETFETLREIARKAGFDVSKLIIAPWEKIRRDD